MFKIGVMVESFRKGLDGGLKAASELAADGVQIYATHGETHFEKLKGQNLVDLKRKLKDYKLEVSALCGDFGGHGFQIEEHNPKRIEDTKRVIGLALELGTKIVTTHIGVVPGEKSNPRYAVMARACGKAGAFAENEGAVLAIETGPETAITLKNFLDDIGVKKGLGVNFDPANLVMVCRENIPQAVRILAPYIVHTHAKDGVNLKPVSAEQLYNSFAEGGIEGFHASDYIKEVPLGEGGVDFDSYLKVLSETGYKGYLTIEREVGENPTADIRLAVDFLKRKLATDFTDKN
jgi:sugar phosphate isomerase/epimerase